jgi:hypothetical protein
MSCPEFQGEKAVLVLLVETTRSLPLADRLFADCVVLSEVDATAVQHPPGLLLLCCLSRTISKGPVRRPPDHTTVSRN